MRWAIVIALAACGDNRPGPELVPDAAARTCIATFRGNFAETSTTPENCGRVELVEGDPTLRFSLPADRLALPLVITIGLADARVPGTYSSETLHDWNAYSFAHDSAGGGGACQFSAGGDQTPQGSFVLDLDEVSLAAAHGTLAMTLSVLAFPSSQCGVDDHEFVTLDF